MTFSVPASSFTAQCYIIWHAVKQNAIDHVSEVPNAAKTVQRSFIYMTLLGFFDSYKVAALTNFKGNPVLIMKRIGVAIYRQVYSYQQPHFSRDFDTLNFNVCLLNGFTVTHLFY